jgi:hypothetical protein
MKVPVVAWELLTKLRKHGGLGIKNIATHALALMARWPIKLIADSDTTWSKLFRAHLESLPWSNKKRYKRLGYYFADILIFCCPLGFGKLHYAKNIWCAWKELRKSLTYKIDGNNLLNHWAIEDAIKLTSSLDNYTKTQQKRIVSFFGQIEVKAVKDL